MTNASAANDPLDPAEYKIRRYRLENLGLRSPGSYAIAGMLPLICLCYALDRHDVIAIVSVVMFGSGIFFYLLGSLAERMEKLRKDLQKTELFRLSGGLRDIAMCPTLIEDTPQYMKWAITLPDTSDTVVSINRSDSELYVVHVDTRMFYDFWVTKSITHSRLLPALRAEIRKTQKFKASKRRAKLSSYEPMDVPMVKIAETGGFTISSGRDDIEFFLATHSKSFPVGLTSLRAAMELNAAAGTSDEPIMISS